MGLSLRFTRRPSWTDGLGRPPAARRNGPDRQRLIKRAPEQQVSLYRVYSWDGSHRWACTVEEDRDSSKGFRIVDHDPKVADGWFLNQLERHMRSSVESSFMEERPDGIIMCGTETLRPGDPGYFDAAARTAPYAWVGPAPRKG